MFCRTCAAVAGLTGLAVVALLVRELPGAMRELRCIRMAKWRD